MTDLRERIDAVLADAADAIEEGDEETLDAIAAAASGIVEDHDSTDLLAAVGLAEEGEEDASIPEALATGDSERVLELERLLKLSKFADREDDDEDHRADLLDLFEDDAAGESEDESEDEDGSETESVGDSFASAAETVADAVTESDEEDAEDESDGIELSLPEGGLTDDGEDVDDRPAAVADESGDEVADAGSAADADDSEDAGNAEDDLRERLQDGLSSFREGIERARGDLESFGSSAGEEDVEAASEEERASEEPRSGSGRGRSGRHSTMPSRKRASLRHSTVSGRSHLSTMPDPDRDGDD